MTEKNKEISEEISEDKYADKIIQAIILAAGQSKRYGSDKTHLQINNTPISIQIALLLKSLCTRALIVINENNLVLQESIEKHNTESIINTYNSGIGSSISLAVKATKDASGWLICLADMPYIQPDTYKKIITALQKNTADKIIVPRYKSRLGHPVGFGRSYYNLLTNRQGDTGAKDIIRNHLEQVIYIDIDDAYILEDIDTPADFERLAH